jgi:hypothetical protein
MMGTLFATRGARVSYPSGPGGNKVTIARLCAFGAAGAEGVEHGRRWWRGWP